jgi:dsDNA-binding SOS-regulon protein
MAVETLYRTTRDPETFFMTRAEADAHDSMLELAESIQTVIHKAVPGISEDHLETMSIYMAKNRDIFAKAFGKKPDALLSLISDETAGANGLELVA